MKTSSAIFLTVMIISLFLFITSITRADSLIVQSNQVYQLGLPGVTTNYSFSEIDVEAGGTLRVAGVVTVDVTSNVLINGEMSDGLDGAGATGASGGNGPAGVNGVVYTLNDGYGGTNGTDGGSLNGSLFLTIHANNMTVNGAIRFNPHLDGGDGGKGGNGGNGGYGPSPKPAHFNGGSGGDGGFGGSGGYGGNAGGFSQLTVILAQSTNGNNTGNFLLGTNGLISLDNLGKGGNGGDGGDGAKGGRGGNGISQSNPPQGGDGGRGGAGGGGGDGGWGGNGGSGGLIQITAHQIDLEGQITAKGGDGGDGGNAGKPSDGGDGGNGAANPDPSPYSYDGAGGNGGDAGDYFYGRVAMGASGGWGGNGGSVSLKTAVFINHASFDLSGGGGGNGGLGQPAGVGHGGAGGAPGGSRASAGKTGFDSDAVAVGDIGVPGADGALSVLPMNSATVPTNIVNGWQTAGGGTLSFGDTNGIPTVMLSSTNTVFSASGQMNDLRKRYYINYYGQYVYELETNEPLELKFDYQWLSTTGAFNVVLGGRSVLHLAGPAVLTNDFAHADLIITSRPQLDSKGLLDLIFQLENGPAQFQLANVSLQALPLLPLMSANISSTNSTSLDLNWFGATNENYQVQYRSALGNGTWSNWDSPIPGKNAADSLALPVTSGQPAQFYRLVMTPTK